MNYGDAEGAIPYPFQAHYTALFREIVGPDDVEGKAVAITSLLQPETLRVLLAFLSVFSERLR